MLLKKKKYLKYQADLHLSVCVNQTDVRLVTLSLSTGTKGELKWS